ncbi:MAG: DUF2188 domain-containing protein [Hyphomicrobiales bacterium]
MARIIVYVTHRKLPVGDQWNVMRDGNTVAHFLTQQDAIRSAVDHAHLKGKAGHDAQVIVQGNDGHIHTEWTYGHDPYPPRG